MKRLLVLCGLGLWSLCAAALPAGESVPDAWQLLLDNQAEEAGKRFAEPGGDKPSGLLATLEGRFAAARMQADFEGAWKAAQEQAWLSAPLEGGAGRFFLRRLVRLARGLGREGELFELAQGLRAEDKTHPAVHRLAGDIVHAELLRRRAYDKAAAMEAADGYVRRFAAVVGPFRDPAGFALDADDGPESQPDRDAYEDATGREVGVYKDVSASRRGRLLLREVLPPTPYGAAAYAWALVQTEAAREVVLSVAGPTALKIWLNGVPVFRGDHYAYAVPTSERTVRVRLDAGVNALLVKCAAASGFALRWLALDGGVASGIEAAAYQADALVPCRAVRGFVLSRPVRFGSSAALEKMDAPMPAKYLWLARAYEHEARIREAREVWDAFLKGHPESVYVLTRVAKARLRERRLGIDAASRLTKEALDLLGRAREVDPKSHAVLVLLAHHQREKKQEKQALDLLKQAIELYPGSPSVVRELGQVYHGKGWTALAEDAYKTLVELSPEWDLERARFDQATGRTAQARALQDAAWAAGRLPAWTRFQQLQGAGAWDEARAALDAWRQGHPAQPRRYRRAAIDLAMSAGDFSRAEKLLREAVEDRAESADLAKRLGELLLQQGRRTDALEWFARATRRNRACDRVDVDLIRRVRKLAGRPWALKKYDLAREEIDANAVRKADHPRANYAVLLRVRVRRVFADRSSEGLVHNAVKVFDKQGIGSLSELSVPQESDALLYCRTVQPDGSVFLPTSAENLELRKATSMYNVKEGSVLEYAYRDTTAGGPTATFTDRFPVEEFDVPVLRSRYVLIVPKSLAPAVSVEAHPETLTPIQEEVADDRVYRWDFSERPGRKPERFLPSEGDGLAALRVEVRGPDYDGQRSRLRREPPVRSSAALQEKARALAAGQTDPAEKTRRVHDWIATEIEEAPGAQTARDAFVLRSGDAGAKQRLCRAMLEALGVSAHEARPNRMLARAGALPPGRRAEQVDRFHGALLHVRLPEDRDRWLAFHRPARDYCFADLGEQLVGAPALEVNPGGLELVTVRGALDETERRAEIQVDLSENGTAAVQARLVFRGTLAGRLRTLARQPQRGPQQMERLAARFFPKITLEETAFPDGSEAPEPPRPVRSPFVFRFRGRVERFCQTEGGRLAFDPFLNQSLDARAFLTSLPREHPFEIPRDHVRRQRVVFRAPRGWCFASVPPDCYWPTAFGLLVVDFTVEGRRLTATRFLILPTQRLEPNEYEALHAWLGTIEKTEQRTVTVAKLPGADDDRFTPVYDPGPVDVVDLSRFRPRDWPAEAGGADGE